MNLHRTFLPRDTGDVLLIFLASWLLVLCFCYLGNALISNKDVELVPLKLPPFGDVTKWDTYEYDEGSTVKFPPTSDAMRWLMGPNAGWYLTIIENGYSRIPFSAQKQENWVFFPAFPLLVKTMTPVASTRNYLLVGWLLSVTFYFLSLYSLWCLLALDFDHETVFRTLMLLAFYPLSFNLMVFGSDSLTLFLSCATFYFARRRKWLISGLLAGAASATRVQGILLLIPLCYMYLRSRDFQWEKIDRNCLALLLAPSGLTLFMFHLYRLTGNPLAFAQAQQAWGNNVSYPFASIINFLKSPNVISHYGWDVQMLSVIFTVSVIPLLLWGWRRQKMPAEYTLFLALQFVVLVSRTSTMGNLRYLLGAFPFFLGLGVLAKSQYFFLMMLVFFASLLGLFVALFANGYRVAFI